MIHAVVFSFAFACLTLGPMQDKWRCHSRCFRPGAENIIGSI